jgi:hypothetical protein
MHEVLTDLFFLDSKRGGKLRGAEFGAGQLRHYLLTKGFQDSNRTRTLTMKLMSLICFTLLGLPAMLFAVSGQGIRCGSDLVSPGYLKYEVLQTCGQPVSREMVGEVEIFDTDRLYDRNHSRYRSQGSKVILYIEEWIYDKGGLYILRFEGNRLVNVESVRKK